MTKLIALVGVNIGDKRFEEGERFDAGLVNDRQRKYLVAEGYAQEVEDGQRVPAEVKKEIEAGAAGPPVESKIDTREEG